MLPFRALATLSALALAAAPLAAQHAPGHVLDHRFIAENLGGFLGPVEDGDQLGYALCVVGDVDGNGVDDIAAGMPNADEPGQLTSSGRVWILFMDADGDVVASQAIDASQGPLPFTLADGDRFGAALAPAGDLNDDGVPDLWVGAYGDDDGATPLNYTGPGALYAVMLSPSGKVEDAAKLSTSSGLALDLTGGFGSAVANIGDLDGNGVPDLVVGAPYTSAPTNARGAIWMLLMDPGAKIKSAVMHSALTVPDLAGLSDDAQFGSSVTGIGDIDHNGRPDFVVGAATDDVLTPTDGSIWFLRTQGSTSIKNARRFAADSAAFAGDGPETLNYFGRSLALLGDVDQDGTVDIAVGASNAGDQLEGTVWVLTCRSSQLSPVKSVTRLDGDEGFLPFTVTFFDGFGFALAPAGDLNGDGTPDLLAGIPGYDGSGTNLGAFAQLALRGPTVVNLGGEVGGGAPPSLSVEGTLVGGEDFTVQMKNGPSLGQATAVVGATAIHAPFKGGVMVPAPDLLLSSFALDGIGYLGITAPWPVGFPLGLELYLQLWMPDANAPLGYSGSNALLLIAGA
ncbi:MAG: hypothetical protein DHS20C15_31990 [Planctomycetota bacterium]|nr:MAG: hypothetical protein DHS20C15_31990 [Planctomycetota bacterium]